MGTLLIGLFQESAESKGRCVVPLNGNSIEIPSQPDWPGKIDSLCIDQQTGNSSVVTSKRWNRLVVLW